MTQNVGSTSQPGTKPHHNHIISHGTNLTDLVSWVKKSTPHEDKPKKPKVTKLFSYSPPRRTDKSRNSSTASSFMSLKSSKNKELEQKYGEVKSLVGVGGSSVVWMTRLRGSDKIYALKSYKPKSDDKKQDFDENITAEFKILSALDHPNVVKTYELLSDKHGALYEILEICEAGDLQMLLHHRRLTVKEADCYFKQLFSGIHHLHSMGVVHRDIKPENLVLTKRGVLKIADFGHSEVFLGPKYPVGGKTIHGEGGTQMYMAPETYTEERFAAAPIDCWAAGIVYHDMRRGDPLWRVADEKDWEYAAYLQDRKEESGYRKIEELGEEVRVHVVYSLLDPKPARRLTAQQFMQSEWAKSIITCEAAMAAV